MTGEGEGNAQDLFWDVAAEAYNQDGVQEGTIFGFRCLRVEEQFVGMPADGSLWVKLPEERVTELIASGVGQVCRPNGRVFREWVSIGKLDEKLWTKLINESIEFVRP